jgi:hypothetical protein
LYAASLIPQLQSMAADVDTEDGDGCRGAGLRYGGGAE